MRKMWPNVIQTCFQMPKFLIFATLLSHELMNSNAPSAFIRMNTVLYFQFDGMFSFGMIAF